MKKLLFALALTVAAFVAWPVEAQFVSGTAGGGQYRNLQTYYGAIGDAVADDTAPLNAAATDFNAGYSIFMPKGTYRTTTGIALATTNGNVWSGEGSHTSIIRPIGAGVVGITLSGASFTGQFSDFGIDSNGATTTGAGISSPSGTQVFSSTWKNLFISVGGNAVEVFNQFSHLLENVQANSFTGHCFVLGGGNTVLLLRTYAQTCNTAYKAGYKIAGNITMVSPNGVDGTSSYWGIFGAHSSITGTAQSGSTSTTIKLQAGITIDGAAATTDVFRGRQVSLTGGTGSGQTNTITAFNKATLVATVLTTWGTTPDATTTYSIQDDIPGFRANIEGDISIYNANFEAWGIDAIRMLSSSNLSIRDSQFQTASTGTYNSSIHLLDSYEPGGQVTTLQNIRLIRNGATRNFGQDIAVDYIPSDIIGIAVLDVISGVLNSYWDVDAGVTRTFNHIHARGLDLPNNNSSLYRSTFGAPTITSGACGTGTNGTISGTNQSGTITIGAAATTTCTVTFSTTLPNAPNACFISPQNAAAGAWNTTVARVGVPSTTTFVITGSALASTTYGYFCF